MLKAVVMHAVNVASEDFERFGNLQPLHAIFESPFEQAVCKCMWSHWNVSYYGEAAEEYESGICHVVAPYIDR